MSQTDTSADNDGELVPERVDVEDPRDPRCGPAVPPADDDPAQGATRRLLAAEAALALVALALFAWSLSRNGYGNRYYAAAARSMTKSWSNFFYGALDPGGWITVDKPPAALWFQAGFAKVFGYSSWSLLMPSAIAGAGAVWLLTVTVRRVWGRAAGLVAGAALMLTPVVLAVSRSNNPDGVLMLCVVAAAWATERAITTRRARWMYIAGALCGVGFLTKLLAAGLVMPGLWLGYLIAAKHPWRQRIVHLVLAAVAFAAVSAIWVVPTQIVSLDNRPYVGGSTNGSSWNLITGYNGLGRVTGNDAGNGGFPGGGRPPGGFPGGGIPGATTGASSFRVDEFGGSPRLDRLFNNGMGDQVAWLIPVAVSSMLGAGAIALRRRRLDARLGSLALWAGWAGVTYVLFALAKGTFHNYYVSLLAPALAALTGIGVATVRSAGRRGRALVAVALLVTAALHYSLIRRIPSYQWMRVVVPLALVLAAGSWLVLAFRPTTRRRTLVGTIAASAGVMLLAPAVWSWNGVRHAQSNTFPAARPAVSGAALGGPGGAAGGLFGGLDANMLTWLRSQRTTERWIAAVPSSMQASNAIINGDSVMAMGGFSGGDPAMTQRRLADLVGTGRLRFVMAGGGLFGGLLGAPGPAGGAPNGQPGGIPGQGDAAMSIVQSVCTPVPASNWGATTSSLYDCAGKADAIRVATPSTPNGGSSTPGATTPAGAGPGGPPGGGAGGAPRITPQFTACMQQHGVTVPTDGTPPDLNDPKVLEALQSCASALP